MSDVHQLRVPQHSVEAEQAVLGALLLSAPAWSLVSSRLRASDFYRTDHRLIFATIAGLHEAGSAVDPVTVNDRLEHQGKSASVGGLAYIATLARDTPSADNIESYTDVVLERASLRRLKDIGNQIAQSALSGGPSAAELVAMAQEQLHSLQSKSRAGTGLIAAKQLVNAFTDDLDARLSKGAKGLQVGLPDLDQLTCGLEAGDLMVIGARPGMGKTALMVTIASTTSRTTGTAVFSAEMPSHQLIRRCFALQSQVSQGLLRTAERLTPEHWASVASAAGKIAQLQLWIDDTGTPTLAHIRAETLSLKSRGQLGLVLIDYVQLVRGAGKTRYEELRDVAYGLKALAKELAVPIIVLAQLNRGVEAREQRRPQLSDLRDSGAIEEAADIVGLLYSEGYYDPTFAMPYILECEIAKSRNGERGHCLWGFDAALSKVTALESGAVAQYRRLLAKPAKRVASDL